MRPVGRKGRIFRWMGAPRRSGMCKEECSVNLPFRIDLSDKVVVITGGSGVLCSMFGRAAAAVGAKVALLARRSEGTREVAEAIVAEGGIARGYGCDVLDKPGIEAVHERILDELGPCDILINGAGGNDSKANTDDEHFLSGAMGTRRTFFDLDPDGVGSVFGLNFLGSFIPTQVFARDMLGRRGCSIINVSSMSAYSPMTKVPAYSAAKAAISNFTQWLAVHFAKEGIRCNAIAPGFFSTRQNAALLFNPDGSPTARTGKILAATPMGRFGQPEELVGALLFLMSEEASGFVNGACIPVDGGFCAYSGV